MEQFYENSHTRDKPSPGDIFRERVATARRSINWAAQYGPFVWMKYDMAAPLCQDIGAADMSRLLLLGSMKNGFDAFRVVDLGLSHSSCYNVISRLSTSPYLDSGGSPEDVQDRLIWTGKIDRLKVKEDAERGRYLTRLYRGAYKELYTACSPAGHTSLGYLMRAAPWLHRTYNIFCHNPIEPKLNLVSPLSLADLSDCIGIGRNKIYGLKNKWLGYHLTVGAANEAVVREIDIRGAAAIVLNPRLLYAGTDWAEVNRIAGFSQTTE